MSVEICQYRTILIADMSKYFEAGRDLKDVKIFFHLWKERFVQDTSFQTQSFLSNFKNTLFNCQNGILDVRSIRNIGCIDNIELMVSLSDFLTSNVDPNK